MNDRELLEAAAKAAGHIPILWCGPKGWLCKTSDGAPRYYWNPLTDDGDALRLVVKLRMALDAGGVTPKSETIYVGGLEGFLASEPTGPDIYAATRLAIVRAAAAMGAA